MTTQTTLAPIPPWKKKLPMWLTFSRMAVCPLFIPLIHANAAWANWTAAFLFIAASITDYFDGSLARKYNAISNMGKFMDPIADKVLVATVLIMLLPIYRVSPELVILLLVRDIVIGGIRSVAAADNVIIDAKAAGKWKTAMQMVAIPLILVSYDLNGIPFTHLGELLLWISVILSIFSGYQYVRLYFENRKTV
jgi:CDP-diacylglycerol--glycerol-3-phosphate 3-phosphatidyltransferase